MILILVNNYHLNLVISAYKMNIINMIEMKHRDIVDMKNILNENANDIYDFSQIYIENMSCNFIITINNTKISIGYPIDVPCVETMLFDDNDELDHDSKIYHDGFDELIEYLRDIKNEVVNNNIAIDNMLETLMENLKI